LSVKEHLRRAIFEATRYGILFCLETIREFRIMYGGEILPNLIADYAGKMKKVEEVNKSISAEEEDTREKREKVCVDSFDEIKEIYDLFIACQPELNELRNKKIKEEKRQKLFSAGVIATIIGTLATLLTFWCS
jgi:hypothetical protein